MSVGCSVDVLQHPPLLGSIITVKHDGYNTPNGAFKAPIFWRERKDLSPTHQIVPSFSSFFF